MTTAGPFMTATLAIIVGAVILRALWAECVARLIGTLPDVLRMPVMESLARADKGGSKFAYNVLDEMGAIDDVCPVCKKRHDADELNFGQNRRCATCATWGRYPNQPADERKAADNSEHEYNRIALQYGIDAANHWLANRD